jgi:hypothetical protein
MFAKQETFDRVVSHLRQQGEPAFTVKASGVSCRYRLPRGDKVLACAVGCLIPDDQYLEDIEGAGVKYVMANFSLSLPAIYEHDMNLLEDLQSAHDWWAGSAVLRNVEEQLESVARKHGLTYTPPTPS